MFRSKPVTFLRVLEAHSKLGRCQVEEIHRQIPDDYRAAVTQMAAGKVRQGLEGLDRINWIKEGQSNYLEKAAADFLRLTDQGRALDRCLAVSFTWDENHRFTDSIRKGLKEMRRAPAQKERASKCMSRCAGPISRSEIGSATNQDKS